LAAPPPARVGAAGIDAVAVGLKEELRPPRGYSNPRFPPAVAASLPLSLPPAG
jgi:hypothetical protein